MVRNRKEVYIIATTGCNRKSRKNIQGGYYRVIFEKIRDIIAERTDIDASNITPETNMKEDLQADSLDLFQIISDIEDEFGVDIESPSEIVYVSDAVEMIEKLIENDR